MAVAAPALFVSTQATNELQSIATASPSIAAAEADHRIVAQIIQESHVATSLPGRSWSAYFGDLADAVIDRIVAFVSPLKGYVDDLGPVLSVGIRILAFAVVVLAVAATAHLLIQRFLRPATPEDDAVAIPSDREQRLRDEKAWRQELERRLARKDVTGALEALWWWMARSIAGAGVDPSWSSRELLANSQREDLSSELRGLDRMRYGTEPPSISEIERFLARLEEVLA